MVKPKIAFMQVMIMIASRQRLIGLVGVLLLTGCASDDAARDSNLLDRSAIVRLADRMRQQGDVDMATMFYERALAEDPKDVAAAYGLAGLYAASGRLDDADRAYREALSHSSDNPNILRDYARLLVQRGDYTQAVTQYRAALELRDDDPRTLNGLGVALDQLGQHEEAEKYYKQVLAKDPANITSMTNYGMSLILAGRAEEAVTLLTPATQSLRATPALQENLALAQEKASLKTLARPSYDPPPETLPPIVTAALAPKPIQAVAPEAKPTAEPIIAPEVPEVPAATLPSPIPPEPVSSAPPAETPLPTTNLSARFGPFSTPAIADARYQELRLKLREDLPPAVVGDVVMSITTDDTPRFTPRFFGFPDTNAVAKFCTAAALISLPCAAAEPAPSH
jgi:Flp pilus assembly protein TadD